MSSRPQILVLAGDRPDPELCRRVGAALARGLLVGLPSETVYAAAARADDPRAVERLRALARPDAARPLTALVASATALERQGALRPLAQRLASRYWPGPLTLLLAGAPAGLEAVAQAGDRSIALRLPAHAGLVDLVGGLDFPLVAAELDGPAALRAEALAERADGALELLVDAGPAPMGEPSAVLRLVPGRFELENSGLYSLEALRRAAGLRIAFVCTGNTCRSPMAEGLARKRLAERLSPPRAASAATIADFGFAIGSMGTYASSGLPASEHARAILAREGVDLSGHRSRNAIELGLERFDRIYCMAASHREVIGAMLPPRWEGELALFDPAGETIPDPVGGSLEDYLSCARQISRALDVRVEDWA